MPTIMILGGRADAANQSDLQLCLLKECSHYPQKDAPSACC
jgi:hypothetical protein